MNIKLHHRLFLIFLAFLSISILAPISYTTVGLDASWTQAILMITEQSKIFGRDFVFTYGPLGYLNFRILPNGASIFPILLIDLITIGHFLFLVRLSFEKFDRKFWLIPALVSLVILLPWGFFADFSFTFFYYFIFWILYSYYWNDMRATWAALAIAILLFFVKVNISLIVCFLFVLNSIILVLNQKSSLKLVLFQNILLLIGIYVGSIFLRVDLVNYIRYTIPMIDGYQDSMSTIIISNNDFRVFFLAEVAVLLVFVWQVFIMRKSAKSLIYVYFLLAILLFLSFKQAHTAISKPNLFGFFLLLPMINGLLFLFIPKQYIGKFGIGFLSVLLLHLASIQYIRFSDGGYSAAGYLANFRPIQLNPFDFAKKFADYDYANNFKNAPLQLPKHIKDKIGAKSVDILQSDIAYVFFNQLNYNPRPIIQSYSAYSKDLMRLNGSKYASASAPDFVFFKLESFREQHPMWIDTDVNFALLANYVLEEQITVGTDTLLLLKKNGSAKPVEKFTLQIDKIALDRFIRIPEKSFPYRMTADLPYSFLGKVSRFLFQPPFLYCTLFYADGTQKEVRVVNNILAGGVMVNKSVFTQKDLYDFFKYKGERNVSLIGLKFHTRFPWGFL
jgi:hypothetical protein